MKIGEDRRTQKNEKNKECKANIVAESVTILFSV